MYNKKQLKSSSTAKGKSNPYRKDVIFDPEGQWEYPGQVTKIPGGNITMAGVPYPVYGEDDLGNGQMMMPGMNYQFPGQFVTEYPMMGRGGGVKGTGTKDKAEHHTIDADKAYEFYTNKQVKGRTPTGRQMDMFERVLRAAGYDLDEEGEVVEDTTQKAETEEDSEMMYRLGGKLRVGPSDPRHAGLNIFTGINFLQRRNPQLYGYAKHHPFTPYIPKAQTGLNYSWSDQPVTNTQLEYPKDYHLNTVSETTRERLEREDLDKKLATDLEEWKKQRAIKEREKTNQNIIQKLQEQGVEFASQPSQNSGTIDYPSTDIRRKDVITPNQQWMYPQLNPELSKGLIENDEAIISAALPIPGINTMGKIPSVFKAINKTPLVQNIKWAMGTPYEASRILPEDYKNILNPEVYKKFINESNVYNPKFSKFDFAGKLRAKQVKNEIKNIHKESIKLTDDYRKAITNVTHNSPEHSKLYNTYLDANNRITDKISAKQLDYAQQIAYRNKLPLDIKNSVGSGSYGSVYPTTFDNNTLVKLGVVPSFETPQTMQHLVDVGKSLKHPRIALPKKVINLGTNNQGYSKYAQIMNRVPGSSHVSSTKEGTKDYINLLKMLREKGVYTDFQNPANRLVDPITGKYSIIDMNSYPTHGPFYDQVNKIGTPIEELVYQKGGTVNWLDKYQDGGLPSPYPEGPQLQGRSTSGIDWNNLEIPSGDEEAAAIVQQVINQNPQVNPVTVVDAGKKEVQPLTEGVDLRHMSYPEAFRTARNAGLNTFLWKNGLSGTKLATEVPPQQQVQQAPTYGGGYHFDDTPDINPNRGRWVVPSHIVTADQMTPQEQQLLQQFEQRLANKNKNVTKQTVQKTPWTDMNYDVDPVTGAYIRVKKLSPGKTQEIKAKEKLPGKNYAQEEEILRQQFEQRLGNKYNANIHVQKNIQSPVVSGKPIEEVKVDQPKITSWMDLVNQPTGYLYNKTPKTLPQKKTKTLTDEEMKAYYNQAMTKQIQNTFGEKAGELYSSFANEGILNTLTQLKNYVFPDKIDDVIIPVDNKNMFPNSQITPLDILKNFNQPGVHPDTIYKKNMDAQIKREQDEIAQRNAENLIERRQVPVNNNDYIETFSQPTANVKVGFRNRGDQYNVKGDPLFYTFAPFKSYEEHKNKNYAGINLPVGNESLQKAYDNYAVLAVDKKTGKITGGKMGDFKGRDDVAVSPTWKISNITDLEISDKNSYNPGIEQKVLHFRTQDGRSANSTIGLGPDAKGNTLSNWSGGHLVIENPETGEIIPLHGTAQQLKQAVDKYKKAHGLRTINIYETDHKSYAVVKRRKNKLFDANYNIGMDNVNTNWSGSGNFVYMPSSKFGGQRGWLEKYL